MKKSHKYFFTFASFLIATASVFFALKQVTLKPDKSSSEKVQLSEDSRKNLNEAWGKYIKFTDATLERAKKAQVDSKIYKKIEDRYTGVRVRAEKDEAYKIGLLSSIRLLKKNANELELYKAESKKAQLSHLLDEREKTLLLLKDKKAEQKDIERKEREISRIKEVLATIKD